MINSVVIAFGHRARSGKDTAANEIIKQRGLIKDSYGEAVIGYAPETLRHKKISLCRRLEERK